MKSGASSALSSEAFRGTVVSSAGILPGFMNYNGQERITQVPRTRRLETELKIASGYFIFSQSKNPGNPASILGAPGSKGKDGRWPERAGRAISPAAYSVRPSLSPLHLPRLLPGACLALPPSLARSPVFRYSKCVSDIPVISQGERARIYTVHARMISLCLFHARIGRLCRY